MRRLLPIVVWAGLLVVVATAVAAGSPLRPKAVTAKRDGSESRHAHVTADSYGVVIQAVYTGAGNPLLLADFSPNGALATPGWSACLPGDASVCQPRTRTQELRPGRTAAGTVFEATATYKGTTYSARTTVWHGTVHSIAPPRLSGRPWVGATVEAHGGRWSGGWAGPSVTGPYGSELGGRRGNFDYLRIEACRTRTGTGCLTISAPDEGYGFSNRPPTITARFNGWYLFAFDERFAGDTVFAGTGLSSPEALPPLRTGATVARSAPLGPVRP